MEVGFLPAVGVKPDDALFDGALGLFDLRVFEEPLLGEARLDGHVPRSEKPTVFS